jgi:phosphoribosyl 1,2-cyclic phosphodiesterase
MLRVTFWGVRGSTPAPSADNVRYGGNTSCVSVQVPGSDCILVFDAGTGLRQLGESMDRPFRGHLFSTHLHLDHVQGLTFCPSILRPGADVTIYGPAQDEGTLEKAFTILFSPPYFPVPLFSLAAKFDFVELTDDEVEAEGATVRGAMVPHAGPTLGYRIQYRDRVVAFIPDHQQPLDGDCIDQTVLSLAAEADLLIHDAQYTPDEFVTRADWGHSTVEYAVRVAETARVRRLGLFSHDPAHSDDAIDGMVERARRASRDGRLEIFASADGQVVEV